MPKSSNLKEEMEKKTIHLQQPLWIFQVKQVTVGKQRCREHW